MGSCVGRGIWLIRVGQCEVALSAMAGVIKGVVGWCCSGLVIMCVIFL
jgi:hypothetical protein